MKVFDVFHMIFIRKTNNFSKIFDLS